MQHNENKYNSRMMFAVWSATSVIMPFHEHHCFQVVFFGRSTPDRQNKKRFPDSLHKVF